METSCAQCSAHSHLLQLATSAHMHQQLLLNDLRFQLGAGLIKAAFQAALIGEASCGGWGESMGCMQV